MTSWSSVWQPSSGRVHSSLSSATAPRPGTNCCSLLCSEEPCHRRWVTSSSVTASSANALGPRCTAVGIVLPAPPSKFLLTAYALQGCFGGASHLAIFCQRFCTWRACGRQVAQMHAHSSSPWLHEAERLSQCSIPQLCTDSALTMRSACKPPSPGEHHCDSFWPTDRAVLGSE